MQERRDDYQERRAHLKNLSDAELKAKFLELADQMVDPLLDLAYKNTSKSIERSVLLRMGFNSLEAKAIVDILDENDLLRKGAGHCVYVISKHNNSSIREAGLEIQDGDISYLMEYFNIYE